MILQSSDAAIAEMRLELALFIEKKILIKTNAYINFIWLCAKPLISNKNLFSPQRLVRPNQR
jgi:hypothetical protein